MISTYKRPPIWHIAYTMPKAEKKIHTEMQRQGISSYLPTYKSTRQWSDRKKVVELPLFPNYIFVKVNPGFQWKVLAIRGVVKFVNTDNRPYVADESLIKSIRKLEQGKPVLSNDTFVEGDKVQVLSGPLSGLKGVLVEKKGRYRLGVRVEALKQSILVDISPSNVELIES